MSDVELSEATRVASGEFWYARRSGEYFACFCGYVLNSAR